jgi:hypothetical protein
VRQQLVLYNKAYGLVPVPQIRGAVVTEIQSLEVKELYGNDALVEIAYEGRDDRKVNSGRHLFELEWQGDVLVFVGHRPTEEAETALLTPPGTPPSARTSQVREGEIAYIPVGTTLTYSCTGPNAKKRVYKRVRAEAGIVRFVGTNDGKSVWWETLGRYIGLTLEVKSHENDGKGVRTQSIDHVDFDGLEELVPGARFSGQVDEWHSKSTWKWHYDVTVDSRNTIRHEVLGDVDVAVLRERRRVIGGSYRSELIITVAVNPRISVGWTYKDEKGTYKCRLVGVTPTMAVSSQIAEEAAAAAEPPVRSIDQVQAYLAVNRAAIREQLDAYNRKHRLVASSRSPDGMTSEISDIGVEDVYGSRVLANVTYRVRRRANYTVGRQAINATVRYLFELEWQGDTLAIVGHRSAPEKGQSAVLDTPKKSTVSEGQHEGTAKTMKPDTTGPMAKTDEQKFIEEGNSPVDVQSINWVGKWRGMNAKVGAYTFEYLGGGKAMLEIGGSRSRGRWSIEAGKICTSWERFRRQTRCDTLYKEGKGYRVFKPDGKTNGTVRKIE